MQTWGGNGFSPHNLLCAVGLDMFFKERSELLDNVSIKSYG